MKKVSELKQGDVIKIGETVMTVGEIKIINFDKKICKIVGVANRKEASLTIGLDSYVNEISS